jgi:glycosyltransferase involved in cell wall biosynthesis
VNQRPWHVVHVIGALRIGGAERQLTNYLLAADKQEFRHTVMCLSARGELAPAVVDAGVEVEVLRPRWRFAPWSVMRFARWLREQEVTIVHTHMHAAAFWGRTAGCLARTPVLVTTEHGRELWKGPVRLGIDRLLTRVTSRHIAVSQDGLELRLRRERVAPERIILIPNGVRVPRGPGDAVAAARMRRELGIAPGCALIGSVGRVVAAKGYENMLAALPGLLRKHPGLRWLVVGDGDERERLQRLAAERGLGEVVVWAGMRDDVPDLLQAMDLWVMSSLREGLPVALLEAMAAGLPIVATSVGGIPDAVTDGREARLVPPGDARALGDAIAACLDDPDLAARLGRRAQQRVREQYSIESVARRIETVYREEIGSALGTRIS